jgi:SAM-dependent methyltransferase
LAEGPASFARNAATYAAARPRYPQALYEAIVAVAPGRSVAWDCATGNGQAAVDLARYFDRVVATDVSAEQIAHAFPARNVEYRVAPAEDSGLPDRQVDLTTVAQALHWLDLGRFHEEVRRVTAPGGVIAVWCYGAGSPGDAIGRLLREFQDGVLGPYWDPRRRWVDEGYRSIPFPFEEIPMPAFELRAEWSLSQLGGYLRSWSAVASYRQVHGEDPVAPLLDRIIKHWGAPEETRSIVWPLSVRVGRVG